MVTLSRVGLDALSSLLPFSLPFFIIFFFLFFFFFGDSPEDRQNIKAFLSREKKRECGHELLFRDVPYYNGPPRGEYRTSRGEPLEDVFENVGARFSLGA